MAEAILCGALVLTVTKTFLLVDAVFLPGGGSGVVARVTKSIHHARSPGASPVASPRQRPGGHASASASKGRSLHRRLLCMHVTAVLALGAGAFKYVLPTSDTSCVVTHRILLVQLLLYDASLVLFLLAKVHVTNGSRVLACWEKGIIWWSRLYAIVYLPLSALYLGTTFPGTSNSEGTFCFNGLSKEEVDDASTSPASASPNAKLNSTSFAANNALLIVQFILLLGMFVKPMLARVEGTQSGGAVYRRVVLRNVICTVGIVTFYAITTVVVFLALLRESLANDKSGQVRDAMLAINSLGTLCLTEIALPLGFSSCLATCRKHTASAGNPSRYQAMGDSTRQGNATAGTSTKNSKVVPVEGQPTQAP